MGYRRRSAWGKPGCLFRMLCRSEDEVSGPISLNKIFATCTEPVRGSANWEWLDEACYHRLLDMPMASFPASPLAFLF